MISQFIAPIFLVVGFTIPMDAEITYYCPDYCCNGAWAGQTASGSEPEVGRTIAADKRFPFGTEIIIDDHTYEVLDRGGAIKGNKIDVLVDSHKTANEMGVRHEVVQIKIAPQGMAVPKQSRLKEKSLEL